MAKVKLNSMPDYQARMPRQPHNVSDSLAFTCAPGMINPVYYAMVHTGSRLKFSPSLFARFNPIIVPFLGQVDFHIDSFFVPLSLIYTPSPSMFYQTDDLISSLVEKESLIKDRFPVVDIDKCITDYISNASQTYPQGFSTIPQYEGTLSIDPNVFDCLPKSSVRFLELLGMNPYKWFNQSDNRIGNTKFTPWFACAYQAVYQLYERYRNDDREPKDYHYNLDRYYDFVTPVEDSTLVNRLFSMRYAEQYKDYFNSVKVSPIGSSVSMLGGSQSWDLLSKVNSYLYNGLDYVRVDSGGYPSQSYADAVVTTVSNDSDCGSLNAANIRQLFMVDKLLRVTGRAEKNYESQFLAHFGIKIPHDVMHNITHIGHDVCHLSPKPVVSTSNTFDGEIGSALGEIGGEGSVRFDGMSRTFVAPCHGVFLVNIVAIPRFRYFGGLNKLHDLSSPDKFWQPEFDKKGMQPIFLYETIMRGFQQNDISIRAGWQFGYEQFKRRYDRATSAFRIPFDARQVNTYAPWVLAKYPYSHFAKDGSLRFWDYNNPLPWSAFKSAPTDLNMQTEVMYDTGWYDDIEFDTRHLLYQTDPFICDFTLHSTDTNFMSEYSEPELG